MPENTNTSITSNLIDIRDISIDKTLPKRERITEYIRQIKDPYRFLCEGRVITARYTKDGPALEDCLTRSVG